jgi:hypothetical protein
MGINQGLSVARSADLQDWRGKPVDRRIWSYRRIWVTA